MNFKTEAQRLAWEKAREHLYRLFGEVNIQEVDDVLAMQEGSTCVYVRAFPIGLEKAGIEIFSHVVSEVKITEDLMRFLLEYNRKLILGAFGLAPGEDGNEGTVMLTRTLLGETLTREELYATVSAVARVADTVDDQLVERFGGRTALGKLAEGPPPERWE